MTATPADVHTLVGAYVLDAVDPGERALADEHLDACTACAEEVVELLAVAAELAADAAEPPPPSLRSTVMARVAVTRQLPPTVRGVPQPESRYQPSSHGQLPSEEPPTVPVRTGRQPRRLSRPLMAVAAGLVALSAGLGAVVVNQQGELDAARTQSEVLSALASAAVDGPAAGAVTGGGRLAVIGGGRSPAVALVVARDLPDLPPGRTYQLWILGGQDPRPESTLAGGSGADQVTRISTSPGDTGVALTVEPDGGSPRPTTPVLVSVPLRT